MGDRVSERPVRTLYFLTSDPSVTAAQCRTALGIGLHVAEVRVVTRLNEPCSIIPDSLVVIDARKRLLAEPPALRGADTDILVVVARDTQVPAGWLEFLRRPDVQLVQAGHDADSCFNRLALLLRPRVAGHQETLIGAVVAGNRELLGRLEREVRAILSDPWGVRTPGDLAACVGTSVEFLGQRCARLGLRRVEHLLTLVRWLAFEHLVSRLGFKTRTALACVGMRDRSNFRRQWRRARYLAV